MSHTLLLQKLKDQDIDCDQQILNDLGSLLDELNLGTEDFLNEWEAFAYNNDETSLTQQSFKSFSKKLRYSQSAKLSKKTKPFTTKNTSFIHTKSSLKPLIENTLTPNTNSFNKEKQQKSAPNSDTQKSVQNNDDLMNTYLSMTTPSKTQTHKPHKKKTQISNISDFKSETKHTVPITPIPIHSILQTPIPKNNSYKTGSKSGQIIETFNDNLLRNNNVKCININANPQNCASDSKQYRFMNENGFAKQKLIRERISFIGHRLLAQIKREMSKSEMMCDSKESESESEVMFSEIDEISQRECYYFGRVVSDGENGKNNRLTNGNIMLESDGISDAYSKRIKLDISNIDSVALFPGQIIAIKGINSEGKEINVKRVYCEGYIMHETVQSNNNNMSDNGVLQIMVGCGPFTPQNSVQFIGSPMHQFGKEVKRNGSNVVLLMGPFTDQSNEMIKNGELNVTFSEYFIRLLQSFVKFIGSNARVIVIPSTKDIHYLSAFPQMKYEIESNFQNDLGKNVIFLSNPCEFNINNVSFGLCSADFLWDCNKIGFTKGVKDRLLAMMSHCINQQSFYPLYPASNALRMDYNNYKNTFMNRRMDIFVMPSNLQQFVKVYKETDTICVNPSFLTRINSGGKYAMINIHKSNDYSVTDYTDLIRVEILRI